MNKVFPKFRHDIKTILLPVQLTGDPASLLYNSIQRIPCVDSLFLSKCCPLQWPIQYGFSCLGIVSLNSKKKKINKIGYFGITFLPQL